jgi:hypothetical protein
MQIEIPRNRSIIKILASLRNETEAGHPHPRIVEILLTLEHVCEGSS